MMSQHTSDILTFVKLVQRKEPPRKCKGFIEHVPKQEMMSWHDEEGLDVMHHVILANNVEVLEYLLNHGYFVRPYLPEVTPYGHLAALLGERTLLQILLQHRPDDYFPVQIPIAIPDSFVQDFNKSHKFTPSSNLKLTRLNSSSSSSIASTSSSSSSSTYFTNEQYQIESLETFLSNIKINGKTCSLCPLEIAARTGQVECVRVILNQCVLKRHSDSDKVTGGDNSDFTLACLADSPYSLALLLNRESPSREEFQASVQVCLQHGYAECLDLLLQLKRDTKQLFKGMNFFHILYTYSSDHDLKSYSRLVKTTDVLVRHGHDVSSKNPSRTYPLYSLLTHAFCFHEYSNTQYYIRCMRCLLRNGADPNFDEVQYEKRNPKMAAKKISGRQAFSSALHCLLETVETYADYLKSPALAVNFVEDCAGVLMGSSGDMNQIGHVGNPDKILLHGSVLHQLCKSSVILGVNPAMMRCVLRHGADPNLKVKGKYAINVYFDKLFDKMRSLKVIDVNKGHMTDALTMCRLCGFMSHSAISECLNIFLNEHRSEISPQVQPYISAVKTELTKWKGHVKSLRSMCGWSVWLACRRQFENVHSLTISSELKTYILPMEF